VPPTVGIQLIRNGVSATTVGGVAAPMADVDGAVCLRNLWTAGDKETRINNYVSYGMCRAVRWCSSILGERHRVQC